MFRGDLIGFCRMSELHFKINNILKVASLGIITPIIVIIPVFHAVVRKKDINIFPDFFR